jgi:hypothetical protein
MGKTPSLATYLWATFLSSLHNFMQVPKKKSFHHLKVGDTVTRMLAGVVPMTLKVTKVEDGLIHCGNWTFDPETGAEIDHELNSGPQYGITISFLVEEPEK